MIFFVNYGLIVTLREVHVGQHGGKIIDAFRRGLKSFKNSKTASWTPSNWLVGRGDASCKSRLSRLSYQNILLSYKYVIFSVVDAFGARQLEREFCIWYNRLELIWVAIVQLVYLVLGRHENLLTYFAHVCLCAGVDLDRWIFSGYVLIGRDVAVIEVRVGLLLHVEPDAVTWSCFSCRLLKHLV